MCRKHWSDCGFDDWRNIGYDDYIRAGGVENRWPISRPKVVKEGANIVGRFGPLDILQTPDGRLWIEGTEDGTMYPVTGKEAIELFIERRIGFATLKRFVGK